MLPLFSPRLSVFYTHFYNPYGVFPFFAMLERVNISRHIAGPAWEWEGSCISRWSTLPKLCTSGMPCFVSKGHVARPRHILHEACILLIHPHVHAVTTSLSAAIALYIIVIRKMYTLYYLLFNTVFIKNSPTYFELC